MIFVDTGAWFALMVRSDRNHRAAQRLLDANQAPLVTSDFIIDETLTLLRGRGEPRRALDAGAGFFSGRYGTLYYLTPDDIHSAWDVFRRYDDKGWSFTDCSSLVVMRKFGIRTAFAFDPHFRQFGAFDIIP